MDIEPLHLIVPSRMGEDGQAFVRAHGLNAERLSELRRGATVLPTGLVKIRHRCQHLTADHRCAIYNDRPAICRNFDCSTRVDCECRRG